MDTKAENNMDSIFVQESEKGKFTQQIVIRNHLLEADEPTVLG